MTRPRKDPSQSQVRTPVVTLLRVSPKVVSRKCKYLDIQKEFRRGHLERCCVASQGIMVHTVKKLVTDGAHGFHCIVFFSESLVNVLRWEQIWLTLDHTLVLKHDKHNSGLIVLSWVSLIIISADPAL